MNFFDWFQLAIICLLGAMSPGPSLLVVLGGVSTGGQSRGVIISVGHGIGIGLYAFFAITGLTFLLNQIPSFYSIINLIGSFVLMYLGYQYIRNSFKNQENNPQDTNKYQNYFSFFQGFVVAILNPKVAVFFIALFSQFVTIDATFYQKTGMVITAGLIDMFWYIFVAVLLTETRIIVYFRKYTKHLNLFLGAAFIIFSIIILFNHSYIVNNFLI